MKTNENCIIVLAYLLRSSWEVIDYDDNDDGLFFFPQRTLEDIFNQLRLEVRARLHPDKDLIQFDTGKKKTTGGQTDTDLIQFDTGKTPTTGVQTDKVLIQVDTGKTLTTSVQIDKDLIHFDTGKTPTTGVQTDKVLIQFDTGKTLTTGGQTDKALIQCVSRQKAVGDERKDFAAPSVDTDRPRKLGN